MHASILKYRYLHQVDYFTLSPSPFLLHAVSFDDMAGVWHEKQNLTSRDGLVTSQHMTLRPIADGLCSVELVHGEQQPQHGHYGGATGRGYHSLHRYAPARSGTGSGASGSDAGHRETYASSAADRQAQAAARAAGAAGGGGHYKLYCG